VVIDVGEHHQGPVMEEMGRRKADLLDMVPDGRGRVRLEYRVPSRGMIGFRSEFLTLTSGSGVLTSTFERYDRVRPGIAGVRQNGVLVSMTRGGRLFLGHGEEVYEGQIVGIHSRSNDLPVNPTKAKQLTNIRASGTDEALTLSPPVRLTLEQALEFIAEDELVEVTPHHIRLRKKLLREQDRKRARQTP
jgi:GTP-binding protein